MEPPYAEVFQLALTWCQNNAIGSNFAHRLWDNWIIYQPFLTVGGNSPLSKVYFKWLMVRNNCIGSFCRSFIFDVSEFIIQTSNDLAKSHPGWEKYYGGEIMLPRNIFHEYLFMDRFRFKKDSITSNKTKKR